MNSFSRRYVLGVSAGAFLHLCNSLPALGRAANEGKAINWNKCMRQTKPY